MSTHTPGPWKIWPGNISSVSVRGGPNAFAVCACRLKGPDGRTTGDTVREGKANAALIAATPDLADLVRNIAGIDEHWLTVVNPELLRRAVRDLRDEARAAIAKAEGTS